MTSIAVIVVNYNTAKLATDAVESVLAMDHGGRLISIHLVDNASPDGDAAQLMQTHADRGWGDAGVQFWPEQENHGFGRGNNLVLEYLVAANKPPDFVFLLNPDAVLENNAIDILVQTLEANPNAAAVGAGIVSQDGIPDVCCFRFPTLGREIVSSINFGPLDRLFPKARQPLSPNHPAGPVDWVAGASVLFRFDTLQKVGFFDPDFFLYFEEVELMQRLNRAGHPTLYNPKARVRHIAGASTGVASHDTQPKRRPAFLYDSWRMYFTKSGGRFYALITALAKLPAAALGLILARLRGRNSHLPLRFFHDHWVYVIRPLIIGKVK